MLVLLADVIGHQAFTLKALPQVNSPLDCTKRIAVRYPRCLQKRGEASLVQAANTTCRTSQALNKSIERPLWLRPDILGVTACSIDW